MSRGPGVGRVEEGKQDIADHGQQVQRIPGLRGAGTESGSPASRPLTAPRTLSLGLTVLILVLSQLFTGDYAKLEYLL